MAYTRFRLDLAIPEDVFNSLPQEKKTAFRDAVRAIKAYAVRINEGQDNEEMTVMANWHVCHHDTGQPCEPENEI
jgi:hypothetical protein